MLLMDLWHMLLSFLDDPLAALPIISHTRLGNDGKEAEETISFHIYILQPQKVE